MMNLLFILVPSEIQCVCFFAVKKDDDTAVLQNLDYYPDKPMPRGIGTQKMVKASISFIFKWVKQIEISDNSQFQCEGFAVNTSDMSFFN